MGSTVGTGVATAQKLAQRPTAFPPRHSANLVGRVIPKSKLPHSHVCTDEFTQTGATYYITIFRFQEGVARVHRRRKLLESAEEGEVAHSQSSKNLVSKKQGRAAPGSPKTSLRQKPGVKETRHGATLPKQVSGNLEWDNILGCTGDGQKSPRLTSAQ